MYVSKGIDEYNKRILSITCAMNIHGLSQTSIPRHQLTSSPDRLAIETNSALPVFKLLLVAHHHKCLRSYKLSIHLQKLNIINRLTTNLHLQNSFFIAVLLCALQNAVFVATLLKHLHNWNINIVLISSNQTLKHC